jgi:hypothetical protein
MNITILILIFLSPAQLYWAMKLYHKDNYMAYPVGVAGLACLALIPMFSIGRIIYSALQ